MNELRILGHVTPHLVDGLALENLLQWADALRTPACTADAAGQVVLLNTAWRTRAALPASAPLGMHWSELVHPLDRERLRGQVRLEGGTALPGVECRLGVQPADAHWFAFHVQPLDGGSQWLWIGVDIHAGKLQQARIAHLTALQADMLDASPDCIKMISLDGQVLHMNRAGCIALGVAADSGFGMDWLPLLAADVRQAGGHALAQVRTGQPARFPGKSVLPGQPPRFWDNLLTPMLDSHGRPVSILCVSRDVTGEQAALESLKTSREQLEIAARVGKLGVWDYDIASDRLTCDRTWYQIMGRDPARPVRTIAELQPLIHPDDQARATEVTMTAAECLASGQDYAIEFRILHPDGSIRWVRSAAYLEQRDGRAVRAIGFTLDITEGKHSELALREANRSLRAERAWLARQNLEDSLTGIANRRHLDQELERFCRPSDGQGEGFCLGLMDVDAFKAFNDRYGHMAGDAALRRIADAVRQAVKKSDVVARYGGEEFAFILDQALDPAPILERIHAAVERLAIAHQDSPTGLLTFSCGCAVFRGPDTRPASERLQLVDEALYTAKRAGRNRDVILR